MYYFGVVFKGQIKNRLLQVNFNVHSYELIKFKLGLFD